MCPVCVSLRMCVFTEGQLCSPILTNPPGTSHVLSPKHHYTHAQTLGDQHTALPPHCQDCGYVEADNTTGLNPSTCDFLQTGLVPVSPLNSPWNTGKSRAAGWSTGHDPNSLFHVLNTLLLLSKWTAPLWMWSTSVPRIATLFSVLPCGQKSRAEYMQDQGASNSECPAVRKYTNPVLSHTLKNTLTLT